MKIKSLLIAVLICLFCIIEIDGQSKQKENYISLSTAIFDVLQKKNPSLETRLELRMERYWAANPFAGVMTNTDGAINVFAGFFKSFEITSFLILTPSFAPGLYYKHKSKDLHFVLEFRSQIEVAVRLKDDVRVGINFSHVSNGSLGRLNPGVESLAVTYYLPLSRFW